MSQQYSTGSHEPNLVNQSTDMMPYFFANSDKLISEDKRVYWHHGDEENNDDVNDNNEYVHLSQDDHNYNDQDDNYDVDDNIANYQPQQSKQTTQPAHSKPNVFKPQSNNADNKNTNTTQNTTSASAKDIDDEDDENKWSERELAYKKLQMIRKLGELKQCGVELSQDYGMHSDYKDMKLEYELHTSIKSKQNAIQLMGSAMYTIVKGLEMANDNYNPLDFKFDGLWSNKVSCNINEYYEVLGQIYEKYSTSGKPMDPLFRLALMLSGSAVMVQMNKNMSNMMPSAAKKIDEDPDLIDSLRRKAEEDKTTQNAQPTQEEAMKARFMKEHDEAKKMAADYQFLKKSENEYKNMKAKAEDMSEMEHFKTGLMFSESVKSGKSTKSKATMSDNQSLASQLMRESEMKQQFDRNQKKQQLENQHRQLMDMNNLLSNMQLEEDYRESVGVTKPKSKNVYTESDVSNASKSKTSKQSKPTIAKSTKHAQKIVSETASTVSSGSTISINPKKKQILYGKKTTHIKVDKVIDTPTENVGVPAIKKASKTTTLAQLLGTTSTNSDEKTSSKSKTKKNTTDTENTEMKKKIANVMKIIDEEDDSIGYENISIGTSKKSKDSKDSNDKKKGIKMSLGGKKK
jgi:hypothetical protein